MLLDHGADARAQNVDSWTPLHQLSPSVIDYYDYTMVSLTVQLLVERGTDVNAQDKDQETPLHIACYRGDFEAALVFLDHSAELSLQNAYGQIPLHRVSQPFPFYKTGDVVRLFLECGVDVNARDKAQDTPLHLASSKWWPVTVQVLLDHGAEANARNADGQNPLHRVPQLQYYHSPHGANIVMQLLKHETGSDVNAQDKDQETPLHLASYYLSADLVKVLLDYRAQIDAEDNRGLTPLHQLVLGNHECRSLSGTGRLEPWDSRAIYTAHLLLERGADINAQNKDNDVTTPSPWHVSEANS